MPLPFIITVRLVTEYVLHLMLSFLHCQSSTQRLRPNNISFEIQQQFLLILDLKFDTTISERIRGNIHFLPCLSH